MKAAFDNHIEVAYCRYCNRALNGAPYYMGKSAYDPKTGEKCKINFYGGFVCSQQCDYNACIDQESSFGAGIARTLSSPARNHYNKNWN